MLRPEEGCAPTRYREVVLTVSKLDFLTRALGLDTVRTTSR